MKNVEHGILHYDVHGGQEEGRSGIYSKIKRIVAPIGFRISESVWVVKYGQRDLIESKLSPLSESGAVTFGFIAADPSSDETLSQLAVAAFRKEISNVISSIKTKKKKLEESGQAPNLAKNFIRNKKREAQDLECAIAMFLLADDMEGAMEELRGLVASQIEASGAGERKEHPFARSRENLLANASS